MTNSPPDIASLSLNSQQRLHDNYDYEGSSGGRPQYHYATSPGIPIQSQYNPLTSGQSPSQKPRRGGLPQAWLENPNVDQRSISPQNNSDFSSAGGSPPMSHVNPPMAPNTPPGHILDDEIIPTAIVIKNIPFNVKRETLLEIIASLSIPTPYAFNYHLDQQGAFRGLAFANFRQAADADAVVVALNGFDVQGRKLRVEYKKVLQASEKERIEREKAIRRMRSMQLEKEHSGVSAPVSASPGYEDYGVPLQAPSFPSQPQRSFSSGSYAQQPQQQDYISVSPYGHPHGLGSPPGLAPQPPLTPTGSASEKSSSNELDLNDPSTLEIYSRILLFKDDRMRDELAFSRNLSAKQRRVVHLIAQKLGVYHYSMGEGDDRFAVVTRIDPQRVRRQPHTLSRAPSAYLTPSQSTLPTSAQTLRAKKSMPDMKTLHSQAPRLTPRSSSGNIREGYATMAAAPRRASGFGSLFANGSPFGGNAIPPVPTLPPSLQTGSILNGGGGGPDSPVGVVRQPRGPGVGGFARRDSRAEGPTGPTRGGLDAQTYEPLEF
ncbi:hypothetical protein CYLTODRAFT_357758 [Cylindrobasidium torrendii FP15055 ss-10]|uniref:RRM domain-containing protein n=1 Tax=Cylindrobasidium torrendii FP15055 ss-10 TaxID=1314674 RepID=A0A0D7B3Z6_9AGAR|nr:hypothetical protein CYLTODRAFT_357758 [Cylindrobasidium torrendii FP15055 ss-10]